MSTQAVSPYYNRQDLVNIAKYATYTPITKIEAGAFDGVGLMAGMTIAGEGYNWYKGNKGQRVASLKQALKPDVTKSADFLKKLKKAPTETIMTQYRQKEVLNALKSIPQDAELKKYYTNVEQELNRAKNLKGTKLKAAIAKADKAEAIAKYQIHQAKVSGQIPTTGKIAKANLWIKNKTGYNTLKGKYLYTKTNSTTIRNLSKIGKGGNIAFAAISLACQAPEVILTYQTLGTQRGTKQLGRAALNTAGTVGGWVVGMKAGAVAGAAIGSCIPVPVVGTIVGTIVGVACGLLGSWLGGKAAEKIAGPSELEQEAEKKVQMYADLALQDEDMLCELHNAANERYQEEKTNGKSEDTEIAGKSLQNIAETFSQQNQQLNEAATQTVTTETEQPVGTLQTAEEESKSYVQARVETKSKVKNEELAEILQELSGVLNRNTDTNNYMAMNINPFAYGINPFMNYNSSLS